MIFLTLYTCTESPYNYGLQITLLQKFFFQTDIIFFDQFKVHTIKIGKRFAVFIIPIALLKKFGS